MKFGKRRWEAKLEAQAEGSEATPPPAPVPESWTVAPEPEPQDASSLFSAPPEEPATIVDGEAVELPMTEVAADEPELADEVPPVAEPVAVEAAPEFVEPQPVAVEPEPEPDPVPAPPQAVPAPPPMPFPVAEEPVLVYTSAVDAPAVTPLAEAGEAFASGHAPGTSPSWPEPVVALAAERPEVVVGAAFAGGLLLAMILRRLGN